MLPNNQLAIAKQEMFSVESISAKILLVFYLSIVSDKCSPAEAFWFTDGIAFVTSQQQQSAPATINSREANLGGSPVLVVEQKPELAAVDKSPTAPSSNEQQQSNSGSPASATSATSQIDEQLPSWPLNGPSGNAEQQQQPINQPPTAANNSIYGASQVGSQCQTDWLESQTNTWLNKWLTSETFCNQVRLAISSQSNSLSNSTGASLVWQWPRSSGPAAADQAAARTKTQTLDGFNNNNTNKRRSWFGMSYAGKHNANKSSAAAGTTSRHHNNHLASPSRGKAWHSQQQQPAIKLVPGERGPKGEQGTKGDQGPSGLTSVKDRDALFDLPAKESNAQGLDESSKSSSFSSSSSPSRRLVFIESEQTLVVNTSIGWRPIQMLAPLSDFRKTIAKFNLNNPADRRKLLLLKSVAGSQDGDASANGAKFVDSTRNSMKRTAVAAGMVGGDNNSNWAINRAKNKLLPTGGATFDRANNLGENDVFVGDEDEDDEDDDDDDDDDDNSIDMSDEDEDEPEDADEDDGDDDDDEEEDDVDDQANAIASNALTTTNNDIHPAVIHHNSNARNNLIESKNGAAQKPEPLPVDKVANSKRHQRAQMSSRSAGAVASSSNSYDNLQQTKTSPISGTKSNHNLKRLRLIALNEPISGNVHGLRGANFECKRNAAKANIKGAFRAFLATNYQNLNEIVRYNSASGQKYPVVNLRNEILANSWWDLFRQPARIANPLSRVYSFDGRHVATDSKWPNKLVWHGTGNKFGHRNSLHNCDGWHSDSMNKFGYASPLHSPKHFARKHRQQRKRSYNDSGANNSAVVPPNEQQTFLDSIEKYPCRMPLVVLCIEIIAQVD